MRAQPLALLPKRAQQRDPQIANEATLLGLVEDFCKSMHVQTVATPPLVFRRLREDLFPSVSLVYPFPLPLEMIRVIATLLLPFLPHLVRHLLLFGPALRFLDLPDNLMEQVGRAALRLDLRKALGSGPHRAPAGPP